MVSDRPPVYRRILVTRMKFIGDVVLTTPILQSIRESYPGSFIAFMGEKQAVTLLEHHPCIDEVLPYDFSRPSAFEQARVVLQLRKRKFDIAIDLFSNPRSAMLTFLSGAAVRVGLDRKGRGMLYTIRVRDDGVPKQAIEFHAQFLAAAGIPWTPSLPRLYVRDEEKHDAGTYLRTIFPAGGGEDGPIIGIHPGATWPAKKWLPERFAALADQISLRLNAKVILTAGPGDAETIASVLRSARSKPRFSGVTSLRKLAALLSRCSVFISNDAGPMHIAASVGTPTIGLFGPGEENIWFPYLLSAGHIPLRKDVPCHPCHLNVCNRQGDDFMECMKLLTVEEVFGAVQRSLGQQVR